MWRRRPAASRCVEKAILVRLTLVLRSCLRKLRRYLEALHRRGVTNGYRRRDVTWVVVRNFPSTSTPERRRADARLVLGTDGEFRVRQSGGELTMPAPHVAYVFDGDRLATFPIRMREDDFISFMTEQLKAYSEVDAFLRRFETKGGS